MWKCANAGLAKRLEASGNEIHVLPVIDGKRGYIIDGMAMVQSLYKTRSNVTLNAELHMEEKKSHQLLYS